MAAPNRLSRDQKHTDACTSDQPRRRWRLRSGMIILLTTVLSVVTIAACAPANNHPATPVAASGNSSASKTPFLSGVIEGFYGPSWSVTDTEQMLSFIHQHGMNAFLYAPKYDPYERAHWNLLYPARAFAPLRKIITAANADDVTFIYSISPGLSITYSSPTDRHLLLAKIAQLQTASTQDFMLSFDDIGEGLNATDNRVYHGNLARAQASLANYVYQYERARDPNFRLFIAQTVYYGTTDNAYWKSMKRYLLPQITTIWTGAWVLNNQITAKQVQQVEKDMGHRVLIWDNYPVNDFTYVVAKRPELFLGPLVGRSPRIPSEVAGYLLNPMYQARASEIPLWTAADYLRDPAHYQPNVAWTQALKAIGGPAWRALTAFARANASYYYDNIKPPQLESAITTFWRSPGQPASVKTTSLYQLLQQLSSVDQQLRAGLPDQALYKEISPWTSELSAQAQVAVQALSDWQTDDGHALTDGQWKTLQNKMTTLSQDTRVVASNGILSFLQTFLHRYGR